jgi:hypothetical protein
VNLRRSTRPRNAQPGNLSFSDSLSSRQAAALVLAVALMLALVPLGARAAQFVSALITDPVNPSRQAHVDANGNLQVTSADALGRQAFSFQDNSGFINGGEGASVTFTVPSGKRLVIEFVSEFVALQSGQRLSRATIQTESNGNPLLSDLLPIFSGTLANGFDDGAAAQDLRLYADAGTNVILLANRDLTAGTGELHAAVSGYLIDCSVATPCG